MSDRMPAAPAEALEAHGIVERLFGDSLLALFLHGSAVARGLRRDSDVDLLAVLDRAMTQAERRSLVTDLMRVSGRHPRRAEGPRCIELVVFAEADLLPPAYPARAEFVYGEWLRDAFASGDTPAPAADPDLTLLLAQARGNAVALAGPAAPLPPIPPGDIRRAIRDALPALLDGLAGDERNALLTLARMWRTAATGDIVAKDEAAAWVIPRLPGQVATPLRLARAAYLGDAQDDWRSQEDAARRAADYLRRRIEALL